MSSAKWNPRANVLGISCRADEEGDVPLDSMTR
jgi:hypothetical protein